MKTVASFLSSLMLPPRLMPTSLPLPRPSPISARAATIAPGLRRLPHGRRFARQPRQPHPAGPAPEYLAKQLTEFKAGKRKNAVMSGMAAPLSEEDMRNVAAFYASKTAKPGFAKNKDTVALGEKIWRGGIAERAVPACAGCHGPTGAGIPAQYPRLGGQHGDYVEAQMTAFRSGARANAR
jgi:cytochrome c553